MAYATEVLADSPLLYWRLGEAAGLTAEDATANNRDGTYTAAGITYSQTGAIVDDANTAVLLNGTSGALLTSASLNLSATSKVTAECWAKFPSFNNTFDLLFEHSVSWSANNGSFVTIPCNNDGLWQIGMRVSGAQVTRTFPRPSTGVFHHCVFVWDQSTTTSRFVVYIDNVVQTLTGASNSPSIATFGNFVTHVGARAASSLFLNATIDEVAIYAGELSAARVQVHYLAGTTSVPVNTVAPVASGTAAVGQTVSVTNGTWTGTPAPTFTYQWQRDVLGNGVYGNIGGATASSYQLTSAELGSNVRAVVTATNTAGNASANSNALGLVTAAASGRRRQRLLLVTDNPDIVLR